MAEVKSIQMLDGKFELTLTICPEEYRLLKNHTNDIVVLPSGKESLVHPLTTGKLGNSNRIMLPKKMLEAFRVTELDKKAQSCIFNVGDEALLLIKIKSSTMGMPKFMEG